MTAARDSRLDGRGVSAKREASRVGRFAMEEVRERWARTSPAMQQMRGILHQGGGQRVLGGCRGKYTSATHRLESRMGNEHVLIRAAQQTLVGVWSGRIYQAPPDTAIMIKV